MIAFASSESKESFLENWILFVPLCATGRWLSIEQNHKRLDRLPMPMQNTVDIDDL
jgi:hypothetical protein